MDNDGSRLQHIFACSPPCYQLLLAKFPKPRATPPSGYLAGQLVQDWEAALNESIPAVISRLVAQGLLSEVTEAEKLALVLKVPELKEKLRERSLPLSGKKEDLAMRLAQSNPALVASIIKDLGAYKCTSQGSQFVAEFLDAAQSNREIMEKSMIDLITRGEFRKAVATMASFEASQIFPRGLGVDWASYDPTSDERLLQLIFSRLPKATANVPPQYLPTCRVAAAMLHLIWNVGQVTRWLSENFAGENEERLFKIASDLNSHALYLQEIESLKAIGSLKGIGVSRLEVLTCNDSYVCESCRALAGRVHHIKNPPEIPNPDCTSSWCRCSIAGTWS